MSASEYPFDLGNHRFSFSETSEAAQEWLDRGAVWLYGFNHDEAVHCFQQAAALDADCIAAYWGIAYAIGPNYNKQWEMFAWPEKQASLATAHEAIAQADKVENATDLEKAMINALKVRYPSSPEEEEFGPYNDAFAAAMRDVHQSHPENLDVTSVFVESLMGRTPWSLWNLETGEPADDADTVEARQVLEQVFSSRPDAWQHPGLLHLYIHLMEMSRTPEAALRHGDALATLVPASGHLLHMATHIDVLCGDYQNTISRNTSAMVADRPFTSLRGAENFYTIYRIHNVHFIAYGAMFLAQKQVALEAATELQSLLPEPIVAFLPDFFEAFWGMKLHVMVRFGMWQEILDEPLPGDAELFSFTTALLRYGRVVALANTGRHEEAAAEYDRFLAAKAAVQETRFMFNNPAADVLNIAEHMAAGERLYKSGEVEAGLEHLRSAASFSDGLHYDEPWGWMQPPRHALAALLMEQQRFDEAEAIYRADLGLTNELPRPCQHPGNVWALHGLHECLKNREATEELGLVEQQLDLLLARADVPIRASCYCRNTSEAA